MTDSNHYFSQFCSWPMKPRKRTGNIYTALNIVFDPLDEILKYEMKVTELSCGAVYYAVQGV